MYPGDNDAVRSSDRLLSLTEHPIMTDEILNAFVERIGPFPPHTVSMVGLGPGDAGLISVRGAVRLRQADVVVHESTHRPGGAWALLDDVVVQVFVGRAADGTRPDAGRTVDLIRPHVDAGCNVVYLKSGDPFVFARGEQEVSALARAGLDFEVVPCCTAASAAAAYAGVPVTERTAIDALCLAVGRSDRDAGIPSPDFAAMARSGTLAVYLAESNLAAICNELRSGGLSGTTPATIVHHATRPEQRVVTGTIDTIVAQASEAGIDRPAVVFCGRQAAAQDNLRWFDRRPLFGQRVLVTRPWHQSAALAGRLMALGANVVEAPTVTIEPPDDLAPVDEALRRLDTYDWLIVTSTNGVDALVERLRCLTLDARSLASVRIAAIGPATADRLRELFIEPDLMPEEYVAEALAEAMGATELAGRRCLLLRSDIARKALPEMLTQAGAVCDDIPAYRTATPDGLPAKIIRDLEAGAIQWATFTSSSTFNNFARLLGPRSDTILPKLRLASIGPITTKSIRDAGHEPTVQAKTYTTEGLAQAIAST